MKKRVVKQYAQVKLKNGTEGCVVEVFCAVDKPTLYLVDIGWDESTWDTIEAGDDDIVSASEWEDIGGLR